MILVLPSLLWVFRLVVRSRRQFHSTRSRRRQLRFISPSPGPRENQVGYRAHAKNPMIFIFFLILSPHFCHQNHLFSPLSCNMTHILDSLPSLLYEIEATLQGVLHLTGIVYIVIPWAHITYIEVCLGETTGIVQGTGHRSTYFILFYYM